MSWQAFAIGALLAGQASDVDCAAVDWSAKALPLEQAVGSAKALALAKGEFESSAQFAERARAAGQAAFGRDLLLSWTQPELTKFDPDRGRVLVSRYAVGTTCDMFKSLVPTEVSAVRVGAAAEYDWQRYDTPFCLTKQVSRGEGSGYVGSNAYGATTRVREIAIRQTGIFIGMGLIGNRFFPTRDFSSVDASPWLEAEATAAEAISLKTNARLLILARPTPPYFVAGSSFASATFDRPSEVTTRKEMLFAMPLCIALQDKQSGKVFAARAFEFRED